ncbi:hypothetical protein GGX14DRAFT_624187 [Mycena pura]|uniref:Uncharacterized protein n=1 Tax=Mycena pura TaxID=153505 RepID=A0AAD6YCC0_9AGAR|nr:hypothetical protein GGX14DRAFT_624187 [Mycena pura]
MAAPSFTVVEITRDPMDVASGFIKNGYGLNALVMPAGVTAPEVFSDKDPVPADPRQGHIPTAFTIYPINPIPISVQFRCQNFPVDPTGTQRYYLVGSGPGTGNLSIHSAVFAIPPGVPAPTAAALEATHFAYPSPLPVDSPFRVTGDWTWKIHRANDNALMATAGKPTRLELYFFLSDTTSNGDHLLDFLRLAVPEYLLIAGKQWPAVQQDVINQIMLSLWGLGIVGNFFSRHYDSRVDVGGAAQHVTVAGGKFEFNVQSIMDVTRSQNIRILANCEDLAALVLVAFRALGQRVQVVGGVPQDVLPGNIESRTMWGYIPDGPLWGWCQYPDCNSPFWKDNDWNDAPGYNWHVNNPTDPKRIHFRSHTYVVYRDLNNNEVVADLCHGLLQGGTIALTTGGRLAVGLPREQYYQQAIGFSNGTYTPRKVPQVSAT